MPSPYIQVARTYLQRPFCSLQQFLIILFVLLLYVFILFCEDYTCFENLKGIKPALE